MSTYKLTPSQEAHNLESRQPALWGCLITFLIINNVVIPARLWVKWKTTAGRRRVTSEDIFIILSGVLVNAEIVNLMVATHYGLGKHFYSVNATDPDYPTNLSHTFRHVWITMVLMASFFLSIKMTLLFFYKRLFLVLKWKSMKIFWSVNLAYTILWWIGATSFYLFQCSPVQWYFLQYYARFGKPVPGGYTGQCNATTTLHVALPVIFSLISDAGLMVLPIWAISKLKLSRKRKHGLLAVFGVGAIACLLELARILDLVIDTDDKTDPSWGTAIFLILTACIETIAVVCACIPVIGPHLVKKVRRRSVIQSGYHSYGSNGTRSLKKWRSRSGNDVFTGLSSLHHITDPEATVDQPWSDERDTRGDDVPMTSFSGRNGDSDTGGLLNPLQGPVFSHTQIQDTIGGQEDVIPGLGKIHVRKDVEVKSGPDPQAEDFSFPYTRHQAFATATKC